MEESLKEPKNEKKPEKQSNISTCEILKAQIRKSTIQLVKNFAAYESTSRHTCAISQVHFPFSHPANQVAKWGNLRIPGNLRKCQPLFKSIFKPLISSIFISHSHSKLRKSPIKLRSPKFQSISFIGSLEVVRLKRKHLRAPNMHLVEHKLIRGCKSSRVI